MAKHILFISPIFVPRSNPEAFVGAKAVLGLRAAGCIVDVLSCAPGPEEDLDQSACWGPLADMNHQVPCPLTETMPKAWLIWVQGIFREVQALHQANPIDCIISRCPPWWAHAAGWIAKRMTRAPWIANWNDPAPPRFYPAPLGMGKAAHFSPIKLKVLRSMTAYADWHTFPSRRLERFMKEVLGARYFRRSCVIPHIGWKSVDEPSRPHPPRPFRITHCGGAYYRCWPEFLQGLHRAIQQLGRPAGLLAEFVGWQPPQFAGAVEALGLEPWVKETSSIPYERSLKRMAEADVLLLLEADFEEGIFFPSKLADYAMTGRPVLALSPRQGEVVDLIHQYGAGEAVWCRDIEAIAAAIVNLYESYQTGRMEGHDGPARLAAYCEESKLTGHLLELIGLGQ